MYLDSKRNTTGTTPSKKPSCFDELDAVLSDKPKTMLHFLASSSEVTDEGSEEPDSFGGENMATSDIDIAGEISNSTQLNIVSSAPSPAGNPAPSGQESRESSSTFYFNKSKEKKKKVNYEEWQDELNQSINSFMTTEAQNGKEFFKKLFVEKSSAESGDDDTIVIKIQNSVEPFFIKIDLERSD